MRVITCPPLYLVGLSQSRNILVGTLVGLSQSRNILVGNRRSPPPTLNRPTYPDNSLTSTSQLHRIFPFHHDTPLALKRNSPPLMVLLPRGADQLNRVRSISTTHLGGISVVGSTLSAVGFGRCSSQTSTHFAAVAVIIQAIPPPHPALPSSTTITSPHLLGLPQ